MKKLKNNKATQADMKKTKERKFLKIILSRTFMKVMIPVVIVALLFGTYTILRFTVFRQAEGFFILKERESGGENILESVNLVCRLSLMEIREQIVFPYDFLDSEKKEIELKAKKTSGENLSPEEERELQVYALCRKERLDLLRGGDFLVITAIVRLGYEVPEDLGSWIVETEGNYELDPGKPTIVEIEYLDYDSKNYPYPDAGLSPSAYKEAAEITEEYLISKDFPALYEQEIKKQFLDKLELLLTGKNYSEISGMELEE